MIRVEAAHRFDVPVERGFAFITGTDNWSTFWPGYVRLEEGSRWGAAGDTARLVTRLLGRERLLTMTITDFEPSRRVTYTSTQPGLPDASHERASSPPVKASSTGSSSSTSPVPAFRVSSTASSSRAASGARFSTPSPRSQSSSVSRAPETDYGLTVRRSSHDPEACPLASAAISR